MLKNEAAHKPRARLRVRAERASDLALSGDFTPKGNCTTPLETRGFLRPPPPRARAHVFPDGATIDSCDPSACDPSSCDFCARDPSTFAIRSCVSLIAPPCRLSGCERGISQPLRVGPSTRLGTPSSAADRRSKDWERHVRQTRHARRACHVHAATGRGAPGVTASGKNRRKFSRVRTSSPARPRGQIDGLGVIDRRRRVSRPESGDGALPRPSRDGTRL